MFNVVMLSGGGTKCVLFSGFETEEEAIKCCNHYDWEFEDENGFVWSLDVEEEK